MTLYMVHWEPPVQADEVDLGGHSHLAHFAGKVIIDDCVSSVRLGTSLLGRCASLGRHVVFLEISIKILNFAFLNVGVYVTK